MSDKNLTSKRPTSQAIRFPIPTTRSDLIKQIGQHERALAVMVTMTPENRVARERELVEMKAALEHLA